jgi:hypothetical protein
MSKVIPDPANEMKISRHVCRDDAKLNPRVDLCRKRVQGRLVTFDDILAWRPRFTQSLAQQDFQRLLQQLCRENHFAPIFPHSVRADTALRLESL